MTSFIDLHELYACNPVLGVNHRASKTQVAKGFSAGREDWRAGDGRWNIAVLAVEVDG